MKIELIGLVAAFLTTAAFVPQALKTIRTKHTADLSAATFSMLLGGTLCWLYYGVKIGDMPLILANSITACLAAIILGMKLNGDYSKKNPGDGD